jgi:hypothetical protein
LLEQPLVALLQKAWQSSGFSEADLFDSLVRFMAKG